MNAGQVDLPEVFKQRFYRQESNRDIGVAQMTNSRNAVLTVLNADSPPDVLFLGRKFQFSVE